MSLHQEDAGCACGHKPMFCHKLNAARWCPSDSRAEFAIARLIEAGDDLLGNLDAGMSDSLRVAARWRHVKHEATVSRGLLDIYAGDE